MSPPLRGKHDAEEMVKALRDGTIDCVATDHAPHSLEDKSVGWDDAANGVTGLETAFSVCYTGLVKSGLMAFPELIRKMSCSPAKILGIDKGALSTGSRADTVIIDINKKYSINARDFASKGKNTPWHGREVYGGIYMTILGGSIVYKDGSLC
jgi:dihydroorotase